MRNSRQIGRIVAVSALVAAALVVGWTLVGGGSEDAYHVKIRFQNASQLVKGNRVQVSGKGIGSVEEIRLTDTGEAEVLARIDPGFAPLRQGTLITVRQSSLSGIANRYLDLRLAPQNAPAIPDGGLITQESTTTAVDLDQLFNVFDPETRAALSGVIRGSGRQYAGQGESYAAGLAYLNPALSASTRLFRELNRDTPLLERFIVESSKLVTDIADRRDELAGLVDNLATTTTAIGNEQAALSESIQLLPDFMRRANTTFLNLRSALDDLDPLVKDSKPVAKKLRPFLAELRPLARNARPTLRDLSALIKRTGRQNDLIELTNSQVPLKSIAVDGINENGKQREGALPASTKALNTSTPELAFARPYAVDLTGWFDDFSHSGVYDALGGVSRAGPHANLFTFLNGQTTAQIPPDLRAMLFGATASLNQRNRCPGSADHPAEDGSNPWKPTPDYNCNEEEVLPGG